MRNGLQKLWNIRRKYPLTYSDAGLSGPYIIEEIYKMTKGRGCNGNRGRTASDVGSTVL